MSAFPAWGISVWASRFAGDARAWYAWRRESDVVPAVRCGHIHRSEAAAERCMTKTFGPKVAGL